MSRSGPRRPRVLAGQALAGVAVLLATTACEKPTPEASVYSGTSNVSVEAACWNFDDAPADPGCAAGLSADQISDREGVITVRAGETIGITVEPKVAEAGWAVQIGEQSLSAERLDETYFRFALSEADLANAPFQVRVYGYPDEGDQPRGLWLFRLERD